jgi:hypothetical protein
MDGSATPCIIGPVWCIIDAGGEKQMSEFGPRNLGLSEEQIAGFCRRWRIDELALFGSVLCSDFGQDSDLHVLVTYARDAEWSVLDQVCVSVCHRSRPCVSLSVPVWPPCEARRLQRDARSNQPVSRVWCAQMKTAIGTTSRAGPLISDFT